MKKTAVPTKIFLGSDHAGFLLKEAIKDFLLDLGHEVVDFGTDSTEPCDYPDFVIPAVEAAVKAKARAVVFGGSGNGEAMAANKVRGARCSVVYDEYTARLGREHNDANVIALGSRTRTKNVRLAKHLVQIWLLTEFPGEARHVRRLRKISQYEKKQPL